MEPQLLILGTLTLQIMYTYAVILLQSVVNSKVKPYQTSQTIP